MSNFKITRSRTSRCVANAFNNACESSKEFHKTQHNNATRLLMLLAFGIQTSSISNNIQKSYFNKTSFYGRTYIVLMAKSSSMCS